mmetsp:Transcript_9910/g.22529  ORF Transcript_9910/g.22529 Transcript_9910/m.22529 type:complete len:215 (-) Transcript_9910:1031-1675(-)
MYDISFSFSAPSRATGNWTPDPQKSTLGANRKYFAIIFICLSMLFSSSSGNNHRSMRSGTFSMEASALCISDSDKDPRRSAKARASMRSAATWHVNAFVDATPISGPACKYRPASVVRAMLEPTTLTMPIVRALNSCAIRMASKVSAVSPLWEMAITTSSEEIKGLRYRNSLAYSTSTGISAKLSSAYFAISPECHDVPQAHMMILFAEAIRSM